MCLTDSTKGQGDTLRIKEERIREKRREDESLSHRSTNPANLKRVEERVVEVMTGGGHASLNKNEINYVKQCVEILNGDEELFIEILNDGNNHGYFSDVIESGHLMMAAQSYAKRKNAEVADSLRNLRENVAISSKVHPQVRGHQNRKDWSFIELYGNDEAINDRDDYIERYGLEEDDKTLDNYIKDYGTRFTTTPRRN
jgi:hypothetical protein